MISKSTKSIPILVRPPLIALNCQKMAESNRKCLRLRQWFVQEEIARAIDTALETIIGLSKRKQFKYHRGEGLFALDFHTARLTSVWKPPFLYTRRLKGPRIASLSLETWVLRILLFIKPANVSNHLKKKNTYSQLENQNPFLKLSASYAYYSIFLGSEIKEKGSSTPSDACLWTCFNQVPLPPGDPNPELAHFSSPSSSSTFHQEVNASLSLPILQYLWSWAFSYSGIPCGTV